MSQKPQRSRPQRLACLVVSLGLVLGLFTTGVAVAAGHTPPPAGLTVIPVPPPPPCVTGPNEPDRLFWDSPRGIPEDVPYTYDLLDEDTLDLRAVAYALPGYTFPGGTDYMYGFATREVCEVIDGVPVTPTPQDKPFLQGVEVTRCSTKLGESFTSGGGRVIIRLLNPYAEARTVTVTLDGRQETAQAIVIAGGQSDAVVYEDLGAWEYTAVIRQEGAQTGQTTAFTVELCPPPPPPSAKPTVDAPEITRVVGNRTVAVKTSVKNAPTIEVYRSGKSVGSYDVRNGYAYPRLGAGNYRAVATTAAGTAYDNFRVVRYAAPKVQRYGKQRYANFRVSAPYPAAFGYQTAKAGKWGPVKWVRGKKIYPANTRVTIYTPNPGRHPTTIRVVVDKVGWGYWTSGPIRSSRR